MRLSLIICREVGVADVVVVVDVDVDIETFNELLLPAGPGRTTIRGTLGFNDNSVWLLFVLELLPMTEEILKRFAADNSDFALIRDAIDPDDKEEEEDDKDEDEDEGSVEVRIDCLRGDPVLEVRREDFGIT